MQAAAPRHGRHDSASGPMSRLEGRARKREQQPRRLLQGEITGRPGIRMTEAEQEIDIGRPGPDAVDGGQAPMRLVGRQRVERREIELAPIDRAGDRLEGADLGPRQAGARQLGGAGAPHGLVIERIERRLEPAPDRLGARGRELLGDHDGGEARKSVRPAPQRRASGQRERVAPARIGRDQPGDRAIEIGFGVEVARHPRSIYKCAAGATLKATLIAHH